MFMTKTAIAAATTTVASMTAIMAMETAAIKV
jgi:hypothetical protein